MALLPDELPSYGSADYDSVRTRGDTCHLDVAACPARSPRGAGHAPRSPWSPELLALNA
ncbi:hypothetical protein OHA71_11485 [Streptomyces sp. NBC_00444]